MQQSEEYPRFLDKGIEPDEDAILEAIGEPGSELWERLREFLDSQYDFEPRLEYFGLKYGWAYKYRRKGKTLCTLFPERGAFTVLVTLGKKEVEEAVARSQSFNEETRRILNETRQYHDGKWVYRRVLDDGDLRDVITLVTVKKRPKDDCARS